MFILRRRSVSGCKGFTLIELGIVVAAISLLASGVMAGKGFMDAAKITKAVDAVDKTRLAVETYVARRGGVWQESEFLEQGDYFTALTDRHLVPEMPWNVGDMEVSVAMYVANAAYDAVIIQVSGPSTNITAMFDRFQSHQLFSNFLPSSPNICTQYDSVAAGPNSTALFCFERSL